MPSMASLRHYFYLRISDSGPLSCCASFHFCNHLANEYINQDLKSKWEEWRDK